MGKAIFNGIFALLLIALFAAFLVGYGLNIVEVVELARQNAQLGAMFVARIAGIVIPFLGAVLGYV